MPMLIDGEDSQTLRSLMSLRVIVAGTYVMLDEESNAVKIDHVAKTSPCC